MVIRFEEDMYRGFRWANFAPSDKEVGRRGIASILNFFFLK